METGVYHANVRLNDVKPRKKSMYRSKEQIKWCKFIMNPQIMVAVKLKQRRVNFGVGSI